MVDKEDLYTNAGEAISCMVDNDQSNTEEELPRFYKLKQFWRYGIKDRYWRIRRKVGSAIIGNPKYGRGILLQIPLGNMDEGQKKAFYEGDRMMGHAGIGCDSGMGCGSGVLDLEWDWSLKGAYARCKRCGYDTRDHVKEYCKETREEHARKNCQEEHCVCRNGQYMAREELGY